MEGKVAEAGPDEGGTAAARSSQSSTPSRKVQDRGRGASSSSPMGAELFETRLRSSLEERQKSPEVTGLRRRHAASVNKDESKEVFTSAEPEAESNSSSREPQHHGRKPSWATMALMPVKWAGTAALDGVGKVATTLSPLGWLNFMFTWAQDVTPATLRRLGNIIGNALHHITDVAQTEPGIRVGYSTKNVADSFVETLAAPKGRDFVVEAGALFVRAAEAFDTPEAHAAYTQAFRVLRRYLQMLASEEADDMFKNYSDLISKAARLGNAPETTVAVAQFVANICHSLEEEHATYVRERTEMYVPFEERDEDDLKREKLEAQGGQVWVDAKGERFEFDESLVLGERGGIDGEGEGKAAIKDAAVSQKSSGMGMGSGEEGLPTWDSDRWAELKTGRGSPRKEDRIVGMFVQQMQQELMKQQESRRQRSEQNQQQQQAMLCVLSFLFFITWTMFAVYGMVAVVHQIGTLIF